MDLQELLNNFPFDQYPQMRPNQVLAFQDIADKSGIIILELPVGSGKTVIGIVCLKVKSNQGQGPLFYIVPTRTLVDQVRNLHPNDVIGVYGRHEYFCLYYDGQELRADEIPCSLLIDCAHRVNQETGETKVPGARPCPYYLAKYRAKRSQIVVCTMAFYLFTQVFSREWGEPAGLVIDEAHKIAQVVRSCLSFEITDFHLRAAVRLLRRIGAEEVDGVENFLNTMVEIIRSKPESTRVVLEDSEIEQLLGIVSEIDTASLRRSVEEAIASGQIDTEEQREVLVQLERIIRDLARYVRSFEFSLPTEGRQPLNYTYAFYVSQLGENQRVQYRLVIKAYYVAPLIRRLLSSRFTLAYSATIGDSDLFGFETGISGRFFSYPSDFSAENTRIFMPTDTANLSFKDRGRREPNRSLRRIVQACVQFRDRTLRSLVVVTSNEEKEKFTRFAAEANLNVTTYGDGVSSREAASRFRDGQGDVLLGTTANYGEGIDLPRSLAPVIFFLRPGYPSPDDPATRFETRRFGRRRWALWNWRVMMEALQVRGRNVRSAEDLGVTFFISQQFRSFVYAALPTWLKPSYQGDKTFEECVEEALEVLGGTTLSV